MMRNDTSHDKTEQLFISVFVFVFVPYKEGPNCSILKRAATASRKMEYLRVTYTVSWQLNDRYTNCTWVSALNCTPVQGPKGQYG